MRRVGIALVVGLLVGQLAVMLLTRGWGFDPDTPQTFVAASGVVLPLVCAHTCADPGEVFVKWMLIGMAGVYLGYLGRRFAQKF